MNHVLNNQQIENQMKLQAMPMNLRMNKQKAGDLHEKPIYFTRVYSVTLNMVADKPKLNSVIEGPIEDQLALPKLGVSRPPSSAPEC